jgi:ribosome-associated protein
MEQMAQTTQPDTIKLDQFLKLMCVVQTGGEAKLLIQNGEVQVNGDTEVRRGRKLVLGDRITVFGEEYLVEAAES